MPNGGEGPTITPADKADYLKGVACMRSDGFTDFSDPAFRNSQVHFSSQRASTRIPRSSSRRSKPARGLIPAGLPYSDKAGS